MGRAIHPFFSFRPIGSSASWYLFRRTRKSFIFKRHKKPYTQIVLVMLQGKLLHGNLMQSYENYTSLNVTIRDIEFIENQKACLRFKSQLSIIISISFTVNFRFKHVRFKEVFRFKEEFHCSQNFRT